MPADRVAVFWSRVEKSPGCWTWTGTIDPGGYGHYKLGQSQHAHRVAYELVVGPIPEGLELDHLCRNPSCVNPAHLEPVTHAENVRRGTVAQRTHCQKGHEYTPENTRMRNGARVCRECHREQRRRSVARPFDPARHKHGYNGYLRGCRCLTCRNASRRLHSLPEVSM